MQSDATARRSEQARSLLDEIDDLEDIDGDDIATEASLSRAASRDRISEVSVAVVKDPKVKSENEEEMESDRKSSDRGRCGICCLNFNWMQKLNQFELFLILLAISGFCTGIQGALKSAQLTKLEKRFNFDSKSSSLIMSANDMIFLPSVMLISYFGSLTHTPRVLALSCFGYGVASVMFALPYFIFGPMAKDKVSGNMMHKLGYACNYSQYSNFTAANAAADAAADAAAAAEAAAATAAASLESGVSLAIFMISGLLEGLSAAPYWNLGIALVDDVTGEMSGVFIGLIIAARILSPSIGYQLYGKVFVHINEDLTPALPSDMSQPNYVPAWWFGFLCVGCLSMLASLPMTLFPARPHFDPSKYRGEKGGIWRVFEKLNRTNSASRRNRSENSDTAAAAAAAAEAAAAAKAAATAAEATARKQRKAEMSFFGFFASIKRLMANPVYICLLLGNLFEFMEINCVIAYMAKYLELHFRIGSGEAAALTGLALPGANAFGLIISSVIASQVNWKVPQLARFHAAVNCCGILAAAIGFFFSCSTVQFVGGLHHQGSTFTSSICQNTSMFQNMSSSCSCSSSSFEPICMNGSNYFSPCAAKCLPFSKEIHCGCSGQDRFPISDMRKRVGQLCEDECSSKVYIFIGLYFLIKLIRLCARSQEAVLQMRCVRQQDKSLGLGINSFVFSIGGIWVPTFVGFLFDKACIFHNPNVMDITSNKACLYYDSDRFRYSFVGFTTAALVPACILFFLAWFFTERDPKYTNLDSNNQGPIIELPMESANKSGDATNK